MTGLPSGWTEVNIEDVLAPLEDGRTIHQGWSPQCDKEPSDNVNSWGVLKTTSIQRGAFLPEHNKRLPVKLTPRPLLEVRQGVTCAGPRARCGVACLVRDTRPRLMLSGKMYRFRFDDRLVNPRFAEAYLVSDAAARAIDQMKTGTSESGLNLTHGRFRKLRIPLPPLSEQQRIVDAVEEQLSRLDSASAALQRVSREGRRYRRALFQLAIPADSETTTLGELLERVEAGKSFRALGRPAEPTEWGVIRVSAMTWGSFLEHENKAVPQGRTFDPRKEIRPGDLLLSRANTREYVGASVRVLDCRPRLLLSDKSLRLVPNRGVDIRWLHLALSAPTVRERISAMATGTKDGMRNISQANLKRVRLPSLTEERQGELADRIESALSRLDQFHNDLAIASRRATTLRTAVLANAFSGRLTHPGAA